MKHTSFPSLFQDADAVAKKAQFKFLSALAGNLSALVLGASMSILDYPDPIFAIANTVILLIGLFLTIYIEWLKPQKVWYGARALAESIKTITWRYAMRAEPFERSDSEAKRYFVESARQIFESNKLISSHSFHYSNDRLISTEMQRVRDYDLEKRKAYYLKHRIDDQSRWYKKKSESNNRQRLFWFAAIFVVNLGAVISSIFKIAKPDLHHSPTDLLIAIAASMVAWVQTKKFQELTASYTLASHEIVLLKDGIPSRPSENSFSVFVADAENAFSREHTQWQARRDKG